MSGKPLVSAIIIFLNGEKFIDEAVESVLAQTYENWELLLVDDGSSDASSKIALRYVEQYHAKVRYLEHDGHQNRGMSASRNLGIGAAKGHYIAFLDADDVWLPHKLELQVTILESNPPAAMVYGPGQVWHSWTGRPADIQRDYVQDLGARPDTLVHPPALLICFLREIGTPSPSGILVRRRVIDSLGGFEDPFRGMYEDQVFYAKVCLNAPVFVSGSCLYKWRRHPNAACVVSWNAGQFHNARLTFLSWLAAYLSERRLKHGELWKVLKEEQKKLWPYRRPIVAAVVKDLWHPMRGMKKLLKLVARRTLPAAVCRWLEAQIERFRCWRAVRLRKPMSH
jgi:glycosyltransferase involved in cell wall biosynthesis